MESTETAAAAAHPPAPSRAARSDPCEACVPVVRGGARGHADPHDGCQGRGPPPLPGPLLPMRTLLALAIMGRSSSSAQGSEACQPSARTPNLEWSGPSMAHGLVGDGSDEACEAWCCSTAGCSAWSNLIDPACHLQPGQRCCMGWPADRTLTVVHDPSSHCTSGRIDGKPLPEPWPINPGKTWQPTWDMAMSTAMMPCNTSGWFDPTLAAKYGLADFDWSNARAMWANSAPMDDGARLITQAAMVKAVNPNTHVWIYRNLVKALSWYRDVGEKLADPAYSGWFLRFRDGVSGSNYSSNPCTESVCSPLYHSQDQTPEHLTGRKECVQACDCGGNGQQVPCGECESRLTLRVLAALVMWT